MSSTVPDFAQLKAGMKSAWMAGDFGQMASYTAAEEFVEGIANSPGSGVLDVACGTGNGAGTPGGGGSILPVLRGDEPTVRQRLSPGAFEVQGNSSKNLLSLPVQPWRNGGIFPAIFRFLACRILPPEPGWPDRKSVV